MAVQVINVPALDPNIFTGPGRLVGGIGRTGTPTLNSYYGDNGTVEFARWVYVGTTGNLSYTKWDGTDETLVGVAAGIWHPILSIKINSSGTTASNLRWGS